MWGWFNSNKTKTNNTYKRQIEGKRKMLALKYTKYGKIAFGRAPRNKYELDYMYCNYNADIIVNLTEMCEKSSYYFNYINFIKKEKHNNKVDVTYKHHPIKKSLENYPDKTQSKSLLDLINHLHLQHVYKKKTIYIHCINGDERSVLVFGCLLAKIYNITSIDLLMKQLSALFLQRNGNITKGDDFLENKNIKIILEHYIDHLNKLTSSNTSVNSQTNDNSSDEEYKEHLDNVTCLKIYYVPYNGSNLRVNIKD